MRTDISWLWGRRRWCDVQEGKRIAKAETRGSFLSWAGAGMRKGLLPWQSQSTHNSGLTASTCPARPLLFLFFHFFQLPREVEGVCSHIFFNTSLPGHKALFAACTCCTGMPQGSILGLHPFFTLYLSGPLQAPCFYLTTTFFVIPYHWYANLIHFFFLQLNTHTCWAGELHRIFCRPQSSFLKTHVLPSEKLVLT